MTLIGMLRTCTAAVEDRWGYLLKRFRFISRYDCLCPSAVKSAALAGLKTESLTEHPRWPDIRCVLSGHHKT